MIIRYILPAAVVMMALLLSGCGKPGGRQPGQAQPPAPVRQKNMKNDVPPEVQGPVREIARKDSTKRLGTDTREVAAGGDPLPEIAAHRQKRVFEFVEIAGRHYQVPRPWRGNKITEAQPPASAMAQIPLEFTWKDSRLYVHRQAQRAFVRMAEEARSDGVHLRAHSGFRSSAYQRQIFTSLMAQGRTWDDLVRYVAPPGYSSHMLGFAIDLYPSNWRFASTEAYRWLLENGSDFGFYETYPESGRSGYPWEAWHWQYMPEADTGRAAAAAPVRPDTDGSQAHNRREARKKGG